MRPDLYLLDTNTVSFLVSARSAAVRAHYIEAESRGVRIAISAITQAEILFGLAKRPEATRLGANFDRFFAKVVVMPWDSTVARSYGALRAEFSATGRTLSLMDLLIAAHAHAVGATLVTHDRAFKQASHLLHLVDWATDL